MRLQATVGVWVLAAVGVGLGSAGGLFSALS